VDFCAHERNFVAVSVTVKFPPFLEILMKNFRALSVYSSLISFGIMVSGCAALDPGGVGFGSYFQILNAAGVVIHESDASKNGYLNCPNSANSVLQTNPSLKGRIVCAQQATTQALPFSIKVHSLNSPTANEMRDTSPFYSRHATTSACAADAANRSKDKKWIILENKCAS
jgi:hypothetical protein